MSSILEAITRHGHSDGAKAALVDANTRYTYGDLPDVILGRAGQLRYAQTRVLAINLDNSADWVLWDLAAIQANVICVPIPPFFSATQVEHVLASAAVDTIVDTAGIRSVEHQVQRTATSSNHSGTSKITFTSGSTGEPKGVCLSLAGMERVANSIFQILGNKYAGNHMSIMPLAVLLENVAGVYAALLAGSQINLTVCAPSNTQPGKLLQCLVTNGTNTAIVVPQLLRGLVSAISAT